MVHTPHSTYRSTALRIASHRDLFAHEPPALSARFLLLPSLACLSSISSPAVSTPDAASPSHPSVSPEPKAAGGLATEGKRMEEEKRILVYLSTTSP